MNTELLKQQSYFLASRFEGKSILVSGSTGLIGSNVIRFLDHLNKEENANISCVALYRSEDKKQELINTLQLPELVEFVPCDVEEPIPHTGKIDYLIHCAGFSGGTKMHLTDPVKVFDTGLNGTRNMLELAISSNADGFLYVSTYEIYGDQTRDYLIPEDEPCRLDPMVLRNCYAEIKRLCESMMSAFSAKYGLPVYAARLTSTFGYGIRPDDPRFFAEFARCTVQEKNIVLKSSGGTVRSYLDAMDAASAFLYILSNGTTCTSYNVTNRDNEISIRDFAKRMIAVSGSPIELVFDTSANAEALGMRREGKTVIDPSRLEGLGWAPVYSLDDTLLKLIDSIKNVK